MHETEASRRLGADGPRRRPDDYLKDYPVREYIAAMATELAQMARWDGDEHLGAALEAASALARRPA